MKTDKQTWGVRDLRRIVLEESYRAGVGHVGSCLSIADILTALYRDVIYLPKADDTKRDRVVLSKGHAALALYSALYLKGIISRRELSTFHTDGGKLGVHPEWGVPGVELATGSLGQGLSVGVGMALAAKLRKETWQTYVVVSDAECNEGSVWEAAAFAAQHKLNNLTCVVDWNGQQGLGYTKEVISTNRLVQKWRAFDFRVEEVDGHDVEEITKKLKAKNEDQPRVVLARTTLGKGTSFMEGKVAWHYLPLTKEQYQQALEENEANA